MCVAGKMKSGVKGVGHEFKVLMPAILVKTEVIQNAFAPVQVNSSHTTPRRKKIKSVNDILVNHRRETCTAIPLGGFKPGIYALWNKNKTQKPSFIGTEISRPLYPAGPVALGLLQCVLC